MAEITDQQLPADQFVQGVVNGRFIGRQVRSEDIDTSGIYKAKSRSTTLATIGYGQLLFAFDDISNFKLGYVVQGKAPDRVQFFRGFINSIDPDTYQVGIVATLAPTASGFAQWSEWEFQVTEGPSYGVAATVLGGYTTDERAVPANGTVVSFTTFAGRSFDPGSAVLVTALADSFNVEAPAETYYEATVRAYDATTGIMYAIVFDTNGSGTYAHWLVQRTAPPTAYGAGYVSGLRVSKVPGFAAFTVQPGIAMDSTNTVPIYLTSAITKSVYGLWQAGSGTSVGVLHPLAGTISSAGGVTATGTGTNFVTDLAAVGPSLNSRVFYSSGGDSEITSASTATLLNIVAGAGVVSGATYAFRPVDCFASAWLIRSDATGAAEVIMTIGSTVPSKAGYTYYAKIVTYEFKSYGFINPTYPDSPSVISGTVTPFQLAYFSSETTISSSVLSGDVLTSGMTTTLTAGNAGVLNSGTLLAARMPALTGDVTTSAGAVATTIKTNVALAGSPTTTTQSANDNSTKIATTAYADAAVAAGIKPVAVYSATVTPVALGTNVSAVDATNEFVTITAHGLSGVQSVILTGTVTGGLTTGQAYWINPLTTSNVAFYTTYANALADTSRVNLSGAATGWSFRRLVASSLYNPSTGVVAVGGVTGSGNIGLEFILASSLTNIDASLRVTGLVASANGYSGSAQLRPSSASGSVVSYANANLFADPPTWAAGAPNYFRPDTWASQNVTAFTIRFELYGS